MENCIVRILPALMDETEFGPASILDEAVALDVTVMIDPRERALDVRPNSLNEHAITGALVVRPGEHDKKRCRVDAGVVTLKWNLAYCGHLAGACLVQYLARLCV